MIAATTDSEFVTASMQRLLKLMYETGEVRFDNQKVFSNHSWFSREMDKLVIFKKVDKRMEINGDMRRSIAVYSLNMAGRFFVEQFILKYQTRLSNAQTDK